MRFDSTWALMFLPALRLQPPFIAATMPPEITMNPLTEAQQSRVREIAEEYHLDLVLLFGSRATGHARANSDYDVGVLDFTAPLTFDQEARLAGEFYQLFKTNAVNVVMLQNATSQLESTRENIALFERAPWGHRRYRWLACKIWEDNRWLRERQLRRVDSFLERSRDEPIVGIT